MAPASRIEDQAAVGDGRSAALVDRGGDVTLGLTRLSLPWLLGAFFTPDRDRARAVGIVVAAHVVFGAVLGLGASLAR